MIKGIRVMIICNPHHHRPAQKRPSPSCPGHWASVSLAERPHAVSVLDGRGRRLTGGPGGLLTAGPLNHTSPLLLTCNVRGGEIFGWRVLGEDDIQSFWNWCVCEWEREGVCEWVWSLYIQLKKTSAFTCWNHCREIGDALFAIIRVQIWLKDSSPCGAKQERDLLRNVFCLQTYILRMDFYAWNRLIKFWCIH